MANFFDKPLQKWVQLIGLMIAGDSIYMLPYMRKTFQTSMEQVYQISSTEVGILNSMFGILAIICYFPSGRLADKFNVKKLLIISLVSTGIGGLCMLFVSSFSSLLIIHAFWGISSILTFWAALIKATRNWAAIDEQGKGFGFLDAGRGAVAAIIASAATYSFALADKTEVALYNAILIYSLSPIVAAVMIYFSMKNHSGENSGYKQKKQDNQNLKKILTSKKIWALAIVIFCAYTLYLGSFDLPAYAEKKFNTTKSNAAIIGTVRDWLRPVMALLAGLLADKYTGAKTIFSSFLVLMISFGSLAIFTGAAAPVLFWFQLVGIASAVFALRGIYFALLEELNLPISDTGQIVGFVSFVGYVPDIFVSLISGLFIDSAEGNKGYADFFLLLAITALVGILVTYYLIRHRQDK